MLLRVCNSLETAWGRNGDPGVHSKVGNEGRTLAWRRWRGRSPANTLVSDFWPPELCESIPIVSFHLSCGTLLLQSWETIQTSNKIASSSIRGFPDGSVVKNLPSSEGEMGLIPGWGRSPGGGHGSHSSILAWETHGQRGLVGCSPWGCKTIGHDLVTKHMHTHTRACTRAHACTHTHTHKAHTHARAHTPQ